MATETARLRAFLAIELPPDVHARLAALKHTLAAQPAEVRWVRDENLHVTLKFLGSVEAEALEAMRDEILAVLGAAAPLPATARGVGVFPGWRRPRVVWAGVECAPLAALAARVDAVAAAHGIAAEARAFTAHVTLGRVNGTRGWRALEALLRAHAGEVFGAWTIAALSAFRSDLRPGGALYTRLWSIPFGA